MKKMPSSIVSKRRMIAFSFTERAQSVIGKHQRKMDLIEGDEYIQMFFHVGVFEGGDSVNMFPFIYSCILIIPAKLQLNCHLQANFTDLLLYNISY